MDKSSALQCLARNIHALVRFVLQLHVSPLEHDSETFLQVVHMIYDIEGRKDFLFRQRCDGQEVPNSFYLDSEGADMRLLLPVWLLARRLHGQRLAGGLLRPQHGHDTQQAL